MAPIADRSPLPVRFARLLYGRDGMDEIGCRVQVSGCRVQAMVFILCGDQFNLLFLLGPEFLTLNSH